MDILDFNNHVDYNCQNHVIKRWFGKMGFRFAAEFYDKIF